MTTFTIAADFDDIGRPEYLCRVDDRGIDRLDVNTEDLWIDVFQTTPSGRKVVTRYRFGSNYALSVARQQLIDLIK